MYLTGILVLRVLVNMGRLSASKVCPAVILLLMVTSITHTGFQTGDNV